MSLDWRVQNYLESLMEQFMEEEGLSEKEAKEKAMELLDQSYHDYK